MSINLIVRPGDRPMTMAEFEKTAPPFSIAIDGYVIGRPVCNLKGPYANFNHHEGVSRLETRATSAQVLLAIRMGLFETFRDQDGPKATVYTNDCDEDVCLTWYLLKNHHIAESVVNPMINKLVGIAELMDTTSGMYPISIHSPILEQLAWVMSPYRQFRLSGGLDSRNPDSFTQIITDVYHRIEQFVIGNSSTLPLERLITYQRIGGGKSWAMIREIGCYGRQGALNDGIKAFISVRDRADGKWAYSVCRISEFIPHLQLPELFPKLTAAEKIPGTQWGGGSTTGGSDRILGSTLSPEEVIAIVNN